LGRIGGLDYGTTHGGWAFAHQFAQAPDRRRAVFTFVAAETPSNLVAVTAISAAVFFVGDRMGRIESETSLSAALMKQKITPNGPGIREMADSDLPYCENCWRDRPPHVFGTQRPQCQ
jgi:hypothetical protein